MSSGLELGVVEWVVPREKIADRNFLLGKLLAADENAIRLSVDDEEVEIPLDQVKKARLELEI